MGGAMDPRELENLVQRAAAGDMEAFEPLLAHYLPQLRAFVRLRAGAVVRAHESCSDLVQSVCREVFEHAERFRHPSEDAFKRWLFATTLRKILKRQRYYLAGKRDVGRVEALGSSENAGEERELLECYRRFSSPSHRLQVREELERVEAAFERLPDDYREVITLAHVAGLSRKEIAEEMGKTEGAVRVLLHRAVARVTVLLGASEGGGSAPELD